MLSYNGCRMPVYGASVGFRENGGVLRDLESAEVLISQREVEGRRIVRIGYDLFDEVRVLLTAGQPVANAAIPTLDVHISLLRDVIVESGAPLAEIPPVPKGYRFIACLTHDVDHPLARAHRFDQTMLGFLYRATVGSVMRALRGRLAWRGVIQNWTAALKLPLVYLGVASDFWRTFHRYVAIEKGFCSTFFVIPFGKRPGHKANGPAPAARGAGYGAAEIAEDVRELQGAGCEIGLHGIDAWADSAKGRDELQEIARITGQREIGVRMHWLYYGVRSAAVLEEAGADYDSTVGYNETVGYRAGTGQAYKPLDAKRLLELPLHIMDTALFYPSHLNLSEAEAARRVRAIVEHAMQSGGCVTVNWHDRSIAPERLWGGFYTELMAELQRKGAWFATAEQAIAWFRRRRSAEFGRDGWRHKIAADGWRDLPDLEPSQSGSEALV